MLKILGDVSIRADYHDLAEEEFNGLANDFKARFTPLVRSIYRPGSEVDYSFDEGSIK